MAREERETQRKKRTHVIACDAHVRLSATPPALSDMRKTGTAEPAKRREGTGGGLRRARADPALAPSPPLHFSLTRRERVDRGRPRRHGHASVQAGGGDAHLLQAEGDEVEPGRGTGGGRRAPRARTLSTPTLPPSSLYAHGRELGEHDGLGARVGGEHALHLLAQRLDLKERRGRAGVSAWRLSRSPSPHRPPSPAPSLHPPPWSTT